MIVVDYIEFRFDVFEVLNIFVSLYKLLKVIFFFVI